MATKNADEESITTSASGSNRDAQDKFTSIGQADKQKKDCSTSSVNTELKTSHEALTLENERLKKQLIHADTLGRIIADCKQDNLKLSKENGDLHERLDRFVRMQMDGQSLVSSSHSSMLNDSDGANTEAREPDEEQMDDHHRPSIETTVSEPEVTPAKETSAAGAACEVPVEDSSMLLSREVTALKDAFSDGRPANKIEVGEVEEIFAAMMSGDDIAEDQISGLTRGVGSTGSVTSQFTKLATIFTRLAQKVMLTQKKARSTQAFCDALLRENHKLKMELNAASKEVETLNQAEKEKSENSNRHRRHSSSSKMGESDRSCMDETLVKESPDASTDEMFANISDSTAKEFITKLQNRVKKLEDQRNEILTVNKQWHSQYNKLKEEAEAKGTASQTEIEKLKSQMAGKHEEHAKRRKDINTLLLEAKKEIEILQRQKGELAKSYAHEHSKVQSLNEKAEKHKADMSCIEAENQRLNQALEAAYNIRQNRQVSALSGALYDDQPGFGSVGSNASAGGEPLPAATEAPEHPNEDLTTRVEVLQQQVKIYREDFETERRDREKSQTEKQRLNEEMTRMRDEMRALNQQVRANEHDFRQERREKQRLQLQLSRIQAQATTGGNHAAEDYYDFYDNEAVEDGYGARRVSQSRDRHRYPDTGRPAVVQTATTVDTNRRYAGRTRTTLPPPYTHDSPRQRRRPAATPARRIRDGFLEPRGYNQDLDVVYPPEQY